MEIERYGFGAPRPHSSWREYVRVKTQHQRKWIKTINEQIDDNNGNKLNSVLEDKWKDLNTKVKQLGRRFNAREPTTNNFLGYKEQDKE